MTISVAALSLLTLWSAGLCFTQSPQEGDVRLLHNFGDILPNCGRVEVYHDGRWGTVCDNSWNKRDAMVVCRQLGYRQGASFRCLSACFGRGTGDVWLEGLVCPSNGDHITQCLHRGWGVHDCTHAEDAGVCCEGEPVLPPSPPPSPPPTTPTPTPTPPPSSVTDVRVSCPCASAEGCRSCPERLRLTYSDCNAADTSAVEGMVEVLYGDQWLPVSQDGWDMNAAHVACGELGYPLALDPPSGEQVLSNDACTEEENRAIGSASGASSTVVQSIYCNGRESKLASCSLQTANRNSSFQPATLRCGYMPHPDCRDNVTHRLRAGASPWMGRVEVKVGGTWGTVHDNLFDPEDANIVCRAVGFGTAISVQPRSAYGRGIGPVHYRNIRCFGNESSLSECSSVSGTGRDHARDVGVKCRRPKPCTDTLELANTSRIDNKVRGSPKFSGSGGSGYFCSGVINKAAAQVICRQTKNQFLYGMTEVYSTSPGVHYSGNVECTGEEVDFSKCNVSLQPQRQCPGGLVQQLTCTSCVPDLVPDIDAFRNSLTSYSMYSSAISRVQMRYLQCAHEENCLSSSANDANPYQYRKLLRFDSMTHNWGTCPFDPNLNRNDWIWHSCHYHYHSFEAFVDFDLLNPNTGEKVAEGHKASFCLEDTECVPGTTPTFSCSSTGPQGISPNCVDRYPRYLDCQWIDITGVSSGTYLVRQTLNPHYDVQESDHRNNQVTCRVTIAGTDLTVHSCWQSDFE